MKFKWWEKLLFALVAGLFLAVMVGLAKEYYQCAAAGGVYARTLFGRECLRR